MALLRGGMDQLGKQLDRVDARTTSHSQALDDIETYVTETAQLARDAADQARAAEQAFGAGNSNACTTVEHAAGTANTTTEVKTATAWT
jgi:methyl-accepting chemotaxis protein